MAVTDVVGGLASVGQGAASSTGMFDSFMSSFDSAMRNPAITDFMATLAQAIDPKGAGGALGTLSKGWSKAKNQAGLMQRALGGGGEGDISGITGGDVMQLPGGGFMSGNPADKLTLSGDGKYTLSGLMGEGGGQAQQVAQAPIQSPAYRSNSSAQTQNKLVNPFASRQPNISLGELSGLTPENINQVVGAMLQSQGLGIEGKYKSGLLDINRGELEASKAALQRANAPFIGGVSRSDWKLLPKEEQEYQIYKASEGQQGREIVSRRKFNMMEPTTKERFLRSALENPEIKAIAKEMNESSATKINIGDITKRAEATADVRSRKFFTDPKGFTKSIGDHVNSDQSQYKLIGLEGTELKRATTQLAEDEGVKLITGAGGKIVSSRLDGHTFIWTVKWPNGKTSEVRYAN